MLGLLFELADYSWSLISHAVFINVTISVFAGTELFSFVKRNNLFTQLLFLFDICVVLNDRRKTAN